jgi:hypothetical protein
MSGWVHCRVRQERGAAATPARPRLPFLARPMLRRSSSATRRPAPDTASRTVRTFSRPAPRSWAAAGPRPSCPRRPAPALQTQTTRGLRRSVHLDCIPWAQAWKTRRWAYVVQSWALERAPTRFPGPPQVDTGRVCSSPRVHRLRPPEQVKHPMQRAKPAATNVAIAGLRTATHGATVGSPCSWLTPGVSSCSQVHTVRTLVVRHA